MSNGFEPPFGDIWDGLKAGKVIPFLGAGASLAGRPNDEAWTDASKYPPNGRELAHLLAERSNFPSNDDQDRDDLAKVSSYTADISGRPRLRERLREVLNRPYLRGSIHNFLAEIPTHLLAVVTNYDTLLEQAFLEAGKPFDLVVYPAERGSFGNSLLWWGHGKTEPEAVEAKELDLDLDNTSVIYKMHGTVGKDAKWDNFVITEEDYVEFLSRMTTNTSSAVPAQFYQVLAQSEFPLSWLQPARLESARRDAEPAPPVREPQGRRRRRRGQRAFLGHQSTAFAARAEAVDSPQRRDLRHGD